VAEYIGWLAISKRLGISIPTARKWHAELGLLVWRRPIPGARPPRCRWAWTTSDQLILAWQTARAKVDREQGLGMENMPRVVGTATERRGRDG
jgi:hypothetical protein